MASYVYTDANTASYIYSTFGMGYADVEFPNPSQRIEFDGVNDTYTITYSVDTYAFMSIWGEDSMGSGSVVAYVNGGEWNDDGNDEFSASADYNGDTIDFIYNRNYGTVQITFPSSYLSAFAVTWIEQSVWQQSLSTLSASFIPVDNNTITVSNGQLVANAGGGYSYTDQDVLDVISNTFGMGVTATYVPGSGESGSVDTTPVLYADETNTDQIEFADDNQDNPLTDSLPSDLSIVEITVWTHPATMSVVASYTSSNTWTYHDSRTDDDYNITYDDRGGVFTVNYPRSAWEAAGDEDLNIFFSWSSGSEGYTEYTYSTLSTSFLPIDNSTITVSGGVLVASGGSDLPDPTGASNGEVLTIDDGVPVWQSVPKEIPDYDTNTIGKVLGVKQQELRSPGIVAELGWVDLPEEIPNYDRASEGDVLAVDSRGELSWTAPSSVNTFSELTAEEINAGNPEPDEPSVDDEYYTLHMYDSVIEGTDYVYNDSDEWEESRKFELGTGGLSLTNGSVVGELGMDDTTGAMLWNGDPVFPACPTTTDGHYMLCATVSLGEVVYEWEPVATASGVSF